MKVYATVIACLAAGLVVGSVLAEDAAKGAEEAKAPEGKGKHRLPMPTFQKMDANADGKVTLEEYQAAVAEVMKERFKTADANGDGALSEEELTKARRAGRGRAQHGPQGGEGTKEQK